MSKKKIEEREKKIASHYLKLKIGGFLSPVHLLLAFPVLIGLFGFFAENNWPASSPLFATLGFVSLIFWPITFILLFLFILALFESEKDKGTLRKPTRNIALMLVSFLGAPILLSVFKDFFIFLLAFFVFSIPAYITMGDYFNQESKEHKKAAYEFLKHEKLARKGLYIYLFTVTFSLLLSVFIDYFLLASFFFNSTQQALDAAGILCFITLVVANIHVWTKTPKAKKK